MHLFVYKLDCGWKVGLHLGGEHSTLGGRGGGGGRAPFREGKTSLLVGVGWGEGGNPSVPPLPSVSNTGSVKAKIQNTR